MGKVLKRGLRERYGKQAGTDIMAAFNPNCQPFRNGNGITRRRLLTSMSAGMALAVGSGLLPAWARSGYGGRPGADVLMGPEFDLDIAYTPVVIEGRHSHAITVNGQLPGPLLRWREGDTVTMRVSNRLAEDTSIHWHGILLPFGMDGVPGVSFPGIRPGETFTYRFPVRQAGAYWYHSHSGLQEQSGHYGPLLIEPRDGDPAGYDRDHIVMLSDWTFEDPHHVFSRLKKKSDAYNYQKRTVSDFLADARGNGFSSALQERMMWGRMRMSPTDLSDVTGAAYTYLVNGHGPGDNWTALFEPGERVRLRFINASAMTIFNIRIPGLAMRVVQADGQNVQPVHAGEIQIGVAETYDVIVQPEADRAYTLMCESMDRSGFGRATLAPRMGMAAAVPPLRKRPLLTMRDMGMRMSGMDHKPDSGSMEKGGVADHASMHSPTHSSMPEGMPGMVMHAPQPHPHPKGFGVDNLAMEPANRLGEPGIGLENMPHKVLVYTDLKSLARNPDTRPPGREVELHLTGNMERFMWSFDGQKYSDVTEPIILYRDERVRLTLVNDTMMTHPIHLHGMFFDVVTAGHHYKPRKHTINVKPGEKLSVDVTADAIGDWAFHCHLVYHMHAGMFQIVSVRERVADGGP